MWSAIYRSLGLRARNSLQGSDVFFADRVYGLLQSGAVTESYWSHLIPRMQGRINEVYCHPCMMEPDARHGESAALGARELEGLISPEVRRRLLEAGYRPVTYPEVQTEACL
jgi:hypothetical protein